MAQPPTYLSQRRVREALGVDLIVRIDPRKIERSVPRLEKHISALIRKRSRLPLPDSFVRAGVGLMGQAIPFTLGERDFPVPKSVGRNQSLALMQDLVLNQRDPENSRWWTFHLQELKESGQTTVKGRTLRAESELRSHLRSYLIPLMESIQTKGWDEELAASGPGGAAISSDGELMKAESANHRFFLARAMGRAGVPLRIRLVHSEWLADCVEKTGGAPWAAALQQGLRNVEAKHA